MKAFATQRRRGRPKAERSDADLGTPEIQARRKQLARGVDPLFSEYVPGDTIALGQVSFNSSDPIVVTVGNDTRLEVSASGFTGIVPSTGGAPVAMAANQWQLFVQGLA